MSDRKSTYDWLLAAFDDEIETARTEYERGSNSLDGFRAMQARLQTWKAARALIVSKFKEGDNEQHNSTTKNNRNSGR